MQKFKLLLILGLLCPLTPWAQELPSVVSGPPQLSAAGWKATSVRKTDAYAIIGFTQSDYKATAIFFRQTDAATLKDKLYAQLKSREEAQQCLYYGVNTKLLAWPTVRYVMQDKAGNYQASLFVIAPSGKTQCMTVLIETPVPTLRVLQDWPGMERLLHEAFNSFAEALENIH